MSYVQYAHPLVFPELTITDPFGHITTISLGSYVSGYLEISKAESVKRVKPLDLKASSSLTGFGGHSEIESLYGSFDARIESGGYTYAYKGLNSAGYFAAGRTISAQDPDWEGKLRLAVKDQKVNLAQTMAEYKQTQDLFVGNATKFIRLIRDLKRRGKVPLTEEARRVLQLKARGIPIPVKGKGAKKVKLRSEASNRYLEYQFGVRPLLQDIAGSAEELESNLSRPWMRNVTVNCSNEVRKERSGTLSLDGRKLHAIDTDRVVIKVKAIVLAESMAAQRLGFTNPMALAWELLPYSFVVDYFVGVGNWLNGLDAMMVVSEVYGTVTRKSKYISTTTLGGYYFERTYGRSVFTSLPGSRPTPQWKPSLGFTRITNILALLSQLKR